MQKRAPAIAFIALYLGVLGWGIVAHTFSIGVNSHVGMYFIVWDMFCGWSAYEQRNHLIAEGQSGQFYDVSSPPWGDVHPYGPRERIHYDTYASHAPRVVQNVLKHTVHEPIVKVYYVEELWSKKFNIPDQYWEANYQETKNRHSYFNTRLTMTNDAQNVVAYQNWFNKMQYNSYMDNPKLQQMAQNCRQFFRPMSVFDPNVIMNANTIPAGGVDTSPIVPVNYEVSRP